VASKERSEEIPFATGRYVCSHPFIPIPGIIDFVPNTVIGADGIVPDPGTNSPVNGSKNTVHIDNTRWPPVEDGQRRDSNACPTSVKKDTQ
jgi:hypothetical protein